MVDVAVSYIQSFCLVNKKQIDAHTQAQAHIHMRERNREIPFHSKRGALSDVETNRRCVASVSVSLEGAPSCSKCSSTLTLVN